jgi:phage major head subunit gpT-like protein
MATLNRENYADLLWVNYTKLIGEGYKKKEKQYDQVFKVLDSDRAYERFLHMGTLPPWRRNNEGNTFNQSEKVEGPEVTIYMRRYDNSFTITHEYWMDNKKAAMQGRVDGRGGPQELGEGLRKVCEIEAARVINDGFTVAGYDGVPLFANNHPLAGSTATVSNLAEVGKEAMTNDNMEAAITAFITTQVDVTGYLLQVRPDKLVVSPDLWMTAQRIFYSTQVAGNNWNDKNVLGNLKIVRMDYLDQGIWFLQDSSIENLVFYWRERAKFGYERIQNTMDYSFYGYARFGVGYTDWRGLYGAKIA